MPIKPNIFISSTFDLKDIRNQIAQHFNEIGAEPLLYEANLTPSNEFAIYKNEMENADFAILIFAEKYGSETDNGISGTHEEFEIMEENHIPCHIYIKNSNKIEDKLKEFLNSKIKNKMYSWYQFEDKNELLQRIKQMTFTIANDIFKYKIESQQLECWDLNRLAFKKDYETALNIIRKYEAVLTEFNSKHYIEYDFISEIFGESNFGFELDLLFIDRNLRSLYNEIYQASDAFLSKQRLWTITKHNCLKVRIFCGNFYSFEVSTLDVFVRYQEGWEDKEMELLEYIKQLDQAYKNFKEEIFVLKEKFEIKNNV